MDRRLSRPFALALVVAALLGGAAAGVGAALLVVERGPPGPRGEAGEQGREGPGADEALGRVNDAEAQLDELGDRVEGLESDVPIGLDDDVSDLEQRISDLERQLTSLDLDLGRLCRALDLIC